MSVKCPLEIHHEKIQIKLHRFFLKFIHFELVKILFFPFWIAIELWPWFFVKELNIFWSETSSEHLFFSYLLISRALANNPISTDDDIWKTFVQYAQDYSICCHYCFGNTFVFWSTLVLPGIKQTMVFYQKESLTAC